MEFRILGPLEVVDGGRLLPLGGAKTRALLALLLLNANEAVSSERLIDELWDERPPPTAAKILQNYVSQLRKTLGEGRLETRGRGYALRVAPGELDADAFEAFLAEARNASSAEHAARKLGDALDLWRGPPLAGVELDAAQTEIARLEERRLVALEERIEADLELGRHGDLVGELEALAARHPLRERLRGQLILAFYRSGRQAEALAAYQDARRMLSEELGIDPSPALRELEKAILVQDPSLQVAGRPPRRVQRRSRWTLAAIAGLVAAGGLATGLVVATGRGHTKPLGSIAPNSVAVIDPKTNRVVAQVPVGKRPVAVAVGDGAVWVANADDQTISRIDPRTRKVVDTINLGTAVIDLSVGSGAVWVANGNDATLTRIDTRFDTVQETIDLSGLSTPYPVPAFGVAAGGGGVWVTSGAHLVLRIDPSTDRNVARTVVALAPASLAVGSGGVWVASATRLSRIEPQTNAVTASVNVPGTGGVATGRGFVWLIVPGELRGEVWRFDPNSVTPTATVRVGSQPTGLAVGDGSVWVANGGDGTLSRVEPFTAEVLATVELGLRPSDVAVGEGAVWVAVQSSAY